MEIWKEIEGCEDYEVSNHGRVRSWKNAQWGRRENPKILKPGVLPQGYRFVNIKDDKGYKCKRINRLVAKAFIPNPHGKSDVNHVDGNPSNDRVYNLEWNTRKENMKHAVDIGLVSVGEDSHSSKITENDVLDIRNAHNLGCFSHRDIAKAYDLSYTAVWKIVNNETWAHL